MSSFPGGGQVIFNAGIFQNYFNKIPFRVAVKPGVLRR